MLVGYVSDERYVALADVHIEFEQEGRSVGVTRSTPSGAIYADLPPGTYRVTLVKEGFGSKRSPAEIAPDKPCSFRLLSDTLRGYIWPRSSPAGEKAEFRVHSVEPYRLSLYRYGWEKEFVALLGWFDEHGPRANMQITPDGDYTQTGVQWNTVGYGSPIHTQFVAAPKRSGLYYLHAKGESGAFFSFPWVVAPKSPQSPLAVFASTNTWNAYNNFGGRSNYICASGLPAEPIVNARQDLLRYQSVGAYNEWQFPDDAYPPLSFERPEPANSIPEHETITDPIAGRSACHLAPAEWRLLGWLEREGYAYDYYSETDLHTGRLPLDSYKALILSVHPEYWSRTMYEQVKEWVQHRGGKLLYLGGNGLNCEVEFLDESRMRCKNYMPRVNSAEQSASLPEYESRFHRAVESEANLLGVVFSDAGVMTAAPYQVVNAEHWIFEGTGLKNGDLFGQRSLHERHNGGASGHETDKRSPHSPPNTELLAKGINLDEGGAELALVEFPGGGSVFSAGSITYAACLLVDGPLSQITRNALDRFLR